MSGETREARWAVSEDEMGRLEELRSSDELVATFTDVDDEGRPRGDTWRVVVLRDGTVTNRNADGTLGVPEEVRDLVGGEDTLYHPRLDGADEYDETHSWVDVVVGPDGAFVARADATPAAGR